MKSKGLRVCHPNVKSLPCHLEEVQLLTCLNNLDFFAMNENLLNSNWKDGEIALQNYQIHSCDQHDSVIVMAI